jgi:hypothetical protein
MIWNDGTARLTSTATSTMAMTSSMSVKPR